MAIQQTLTERVRYSGSPLPWITSVGAFTSTLDTAVTLYDLIPLVHRETYLGHTRLEKCRSRWDGLSVSVRTSAGMPNFDVVIELG